MEIEYLINQIYQFLDINTYFNLLSYLMLNSTEETKQDPV
jgi:hypothetical protein